MKLKIFCVLALSVLILFACKKSSDTTPNPALASITVVNATLNIGSLKVNRYQSGLSYATLSDSIVYESAIEYPISSGNQPITIVLTRDTTNILYKNVFNFLPYKSYSFYLAGQTPDIKAFSFQDNIPVYKDSTAGVRFINLSQNSNPVSINLQGNSTGQTEFTNLSFGQISQFKSYPANQISGAVRTYTFEVRDLSTGNLLITYTWPFAVEKNNTLVISGLINGAGSNALSVFSVNNY